MTTKTYEASSVEEALAQAAQDLGADAADLQHEVQEKSEDFWGLGSTVYAVTVTVPEDESPAAPAEAGGENLPPFFVADESAEAAPTATAQQEAAQQEDSAPEADASQESAPEPVAAADVPAPDAASAANTDASAAPAPVTSEPAAEGQDMTAEAIAILDRIFVTMGFECEAEAKLDGDTMHVAITGEDNQYLLEGRGRGLSALELILNHSFRAWPNRSHKRVRVDAGDFRSQRDDEIRDIAFQVAHRAKETGSEQQTSELNPYERRIVHLALADDQSVTTRSLGNGFLKAVNVIPSRRRD
ncbi:MAG: hypothetical protein GKS06_01785 [Acidobacteria bacterium]|nr:hypothetical protein [Acidobacteriota bacterium]